MSKENEGQEMVLGRCHYCRAMMEQSKLCEHEQGCGKVSASPIRGTQVFSWRERWTGALPALDFYEYCVTSITYGSRGRW